MLTNLPATRDHSLEIERIPLRVTISEDGVLPISFRLPPIEEIEEIRELGLLNVSVRDKIFPELESKLKASLEIELEGLKTKYSKFRDSSTYLNYLATLSEMIGDIDSAASYIAEARALDSDVFFAHKEGALLMHRGKESEAQLLFGALDLRNDVYANLRLGYLKAIKNDLSAAMEYVLQALHIEPDNFGARLFAGALHLAMGNYSQAVRNFRVAAEERENSSPLYVNLAIAQICLGHTQKALRSLRQAIAINPLNHNALVMYADLSARHQVGSIAIGPLERYLRYEQKTADIWARLARAHYESGDPQKALIALKREASNREGPTVWNNMGVVYLKQGQQPTAAKFFGRAIAGIDDHVAFSDAGARAALVNIVELLVVQQRFREAESFSTNIIRRDLDAVLAQDPVACDLYLRNLYSLLRMGRYEELQKRSEAILSLESAHMHLRMGTYQTLLSFFSVTKPDSKRAQDALEGAIALVSANTNRELTHRSGLINNIAFVLADQGQLEEAEKFASEMALNAHKEPYPTATLGLLQLKKGHMERGEELYRNAIRLAKFDIDKHRIEQKMHLELGRLLMTQGKANMAARQMERAKGFRDGEQAISIMADRELRLIRQMPS
jgi:tetratricopeptide (TPR) repeat protein